MNDRQSALLEAEAEDEDEDEDEESEEEEGDEEDEEAGGKGGAEAGGGAEPPQLSASDFRNRGSSQLLGARSCLASRNGVARSSLAPHQASAQTPKRNAPKLKPNKPAVAFSVPSPTVAQHTSLDAQQATPPTSPRASALGTSALGVFAGWGSHILPTGRARVRLRLRLWG